MGERYVGEGMYREDFKLIESWQDRAFCGQLLKISIRLDWLF